MDTTRMMFGNQHFPYQYGQLPRNFDANGLPPSQVDGGYPISPPYAAVAIDWRNSHPRIDRIRLMMQEEIIKLSKWAKCNYQPPSKVHQIAAYLEGRLFEEAASLDEYMDRKNLHARIRNELQRSRGAGAEANKFYKPVPIHQVMPDASCPAFYPSMDHIVDSTALPIYQVMPDASCSPFYPSTDHIVGSTAVSEDYGQCSSSDDVFGVCTEFLAGQGHIIGGYLQGHDVSPVPFLREQQPSRVIASDPFASLKRIPGYSRPWNDASACDGVISPQVNQQNSYGAPVQDHRLAQKNLQCGDIRNVSPVEQRDMSFHNTIRNVHLELPSNQFNPLNCVALKGTSTSSGSRISPASNPSPPSGAQWVGCGEKRKLPPPLLSSWPVSSGELEVMPYVQKRFKMSDHFGSFSSICENPQQFMMVEYCRDETLPKLQQHPESPISIDSQYDVLQPVACDIPGINKMVPIPVQGGSAWNHGNAVSPLEEIFVASIVDKMDNVVVERLADSGSQGSGSRSMVSLFEERTHGLDDGRQIMEDTSKSNQETVDCTSKDVTIAPNVYNTDLMKQDLASQAICGYGGSRSGGVPLLSEEPNPCLEEEGQDLATDETPVDNSGLRSDRLSPLSGELSPCLEEERQIIEPAEKGLERNPRLSEGFQEEIHEVPMSGSIKITGASLLEYLTREEIEMHLSGLKESSCQIKPLDSEMDAAHTTSQTACLLCGEFKHSFAPMTMYCSSCNKIIDYNSKYYTPQDGGEKLYVCSVCYGRKGKDIPYRGGFISKEKLQRKMRNEEGVEEPWVQCERCEAWHHQICGLFNDSKNVAGNAEYICPLCCLEVMKEDARMTFRRGRAFSAKDLPRTKLSDHIERRLRERLKQDREERAKASGKNFHEVPGAEDLVVRVVSSLPKKVQVHKQFMGIFAGLNYPSELPYKSKVITLFQKIEGVDVLLFGMYVQEYGSDCSQPNNRCVYISYLDSVKYFRPDIRSASGESLRTFVYHEILLGYHEYCKKCGFLSCYLWVCPPTKGDDFLLYCHPKFQKNQMQKGLRKWYKTMFKNATDRNIVSSYTNLSEFYFTPSGSDKHKITAARLPYFEGDFWPSNLERFLKDIDQKAAEENMNNMSKRALKACKNFSKYSIKDSKLIEKIERSMKDNKEDFMVAHLQYVCTACHEVILSGKRWFCDRCSKQKPLLCERCVDAGKVGRNAEGFLVCRAKHLLSEAVVDSVPCDTEDGDITIENQLFENRHSFLEFCQENHYQFDTLRRAKHSTMMILYHLNEHKDQIVESCCSLCQGELSGPSRKCKICPEFRACNACYVRQGFSHSHELTPSSSADDLAPEVQLNWLVNMDTEDILSHVVHCSQCIPSESEPCSYLQCSKIKGLFHHSTQCSHGGASKGCECCQNMWLMLQLHAKECINSDCRVPWCRKLKERISMQSVKHGDKGIHKTLISA